MTSLKNCRSFMMNLPVIIFFFALALFIVTGCQKDFRDSSSESLRTQPTSLGSLSSGQQLNIIYIMSDDIGYEIPTYNGGSSYSTPNLDFMAANGVQFPNFFSHPDGSPSRLAAMTGKYSYQNYGDWGYLASDQKTFGNMLRDAGYATCFVGKWQMDGGDFAIRNGGFNKYLAFLPYTPPYGSSDSDQYYRRYKNPLLYQNGNYLPDSAVAGKYSEDMFYNYSSDFIDSNKNKPFLLFYSCNLAQRPWTPTPDDPEFARWNPATDDMYRQNKKYFPGMIAYMDKNIGKLIAKVQSAGLASKTVFIFTSDNATNRNIQSVYKGTTVSGAKNYTYRAGINVPLVCYGSTALKKGKRDTALVDMTDFLPTMAGLAGIPVPTTYGTLDGTTFYDNLTGARKKTERTYVFCHWIDKFATNADRPPVQRYAFDFKYKLYDTVAPANNLYNLITDPTELKPIPTTGMSKTETNERNFLQGVLNSHK